MVAANSTNLSFDNIMTFFKQTRARLPNATYEGYRLYLIPTIAIKVATGGVNSCLGFVGVYESNSGESTVKSETITISGSMTGFSDLD